MKKETIETCYNHQQTYFAAHKNPDSEAIVKNLEALKEAIKTHEDAIIKAIYADFKKPEFEVLTNELYVVYKELNLFIKKIAAWRRPKRITSDWLNFPSSDRIHYVPWGNCLVIAPWNYPFQLALVPLIGAIACGNTVMLKPSEYAPNTAKIIETLIHQVFDKSQAVVVQGGVETSKFILSLKWDYVFFTGSVPVGKKVSKAIAKHMTPHTLELGGKNPCVVSKHANLKVSVKRIIWGKYLNAGQTCIAPDYLMIDQEIKDQFIAEFRTQIQAFYGKTPESSKDYARIISDHHFERLARFINEEKVILGGSVNAKDRYIEPTLIDAPELDQPIMQEEIFGPLLPVFTYQKLTDIESLIHKIDKPLALYAFTNHQEEQAYLTHQFDYGGGVINDCIVQFVNDKLPFGGVGSSGLGQYHGKHTFYTFTRQKAIVNRNTAIDIPIKYPPYTKTNLFKRFLKFFR